MQKSSIPFRTSEEILKQIQDLGLNHPTSRPDWHTYWLLYAKLVSIRSNDARTKCGAVFVRDQTCISTGYNGTIFGINDSALPNFEYNDDIVLSKADYFIHAEINAIIFAAKNGHSTKGCSAYITTNPCIRCWQAMYQAGIECIYIPETSKTPVCMQNNHYKEQLSLLEHLTSNKLPIIKIKWDQSN